MDESVATAPDGEPAPTRHAYRALWALPQWRRWTVASGLARMPVAMAPLALVLAGREATGSYASGAVLASFHALGEAVGAPLRGRAIDRSEVPASLVRALWVEAGCFAVLALGIAGRAPLWSLLAVALVAGVIPAGVPGGLRSLLPRVVPERMSETAFAVDASLVELQWISGPALVSALVVWGSGSLAVAAMALFAAIAAFAAGRLPRREPVHAVTSVGAWRQASAQPVYLLTLVAGAGLGMLDSALPPFLETIGTDGDKAGFVAGVLAISSAAGGLLYGSRVHDASTVMRRAALAFVAFGLLLSPMLLVTDARAAIVVFLVAGLPLAPQNALLATWLERAVARDRQAEAFSVSYSAMALGFGAGGLVTASLLQSGGPRVVFATAVALPLLAGFVTFVATRGRRVEAVA